MGAAAGGGRTFAALVGNIALIRLSANSQWRLNAYNWQYVAGLLLPVAGVFGTVFFYTLTEDTQRATGQHHGLKPRRPDARRCPA